MTAWVSPLKLHRTGLLGMNRRNLDYIARYNDRRLYPLVDDKLQTKLLAERHGISTPVLRYVVREQHQIARVLPLLEELGAFALKPARGSGGKGIWVIQRREEGRFIKSSGAALTGDDVSRHLSNTLAGLYSLSGKPDVVLVEDLIRISSQFHDYSHEGVPDIRVVVFRGYPVMAMLRLATHDSDGKANLHQGAVGVGLDLATGRALHAVQHGKPAFLHPDTGKPLSELQLPAWRSLLKLAARCYEMTGLGYLGADLVIDEKLGPQVLELNARPGLAIQMANGVGLVPRLKHIEGLDCLDRESPGERVRRVMAAFA